MVPSILNLLDVDDIFVDGNTTRRDRRDPTDLIVIAPHAGQTGWG